MKIIAVGRNYLDHAKELNNPVPSEPVIFLKPDTALLKENKAFYIPGFSQNIHHEVELVIKISKEGKYIQEKFAHNYFEEISLGIDFTARDLQDQCKAKALPWEIAKAFDHSAPIGTFKSITQYADLSNLSFHLKKNDLIVQEGNSSDMIFSFAKIITYVSRFFTLKKGDLIFTGTPAGVGQVNVGDHLEAYLEGDKVLNLEVK